MQKIVIEATLRQFVAVGLFVVAALSANVYQYLHIGELNETVRTQEIALKMQAGLYDKASQQLQEDERIIERAETELAALKRQVLRERMVRRVTLINAKAPAEVIADTVLAAAEANRIDPVLLLALVEVESHYDPKAVSVTGARGLSQFIQSTAKEVGLDWGQAFDPELSIKHGAAYLRNRIDLARGNVWMGLGYYNGFSDPEYQDKVFRVQAKLKI